MNCGFAGGGKSIIVSQKCVYHSLKKISRCPRTLLFLFQTLKQFKGQGAGFPIQCVLFALCTLIFSVFTWGTVGATTATEKLRILQKDFWSLISALCILKTFLYEENMLPFD